MTEQQAGSFLPPTWADDLARQVLADLGAIYAPIREQARREDGQLRRDHPWQWRAKHARRWLRRRSRQAARLTPIRWVGFGHDPGGRWET